MPKYAPVTREDVLATAALARIDISSGRHNMVDLMAEQLTAIIGYMDVINQVDTSAVEPLYSPMRDVAGPRPDEALRRLDVEDILAGAPERQNTFFVVPPVI